ncbi:MAG: metal-dependent hydrolase [Chloroflexi bacterium]|nr:metal-dependent hydrolase [Chloroflexota bacterium]
MDVFGHVGLTLAVAYPIERIAVRYVSAVRGGRHAPPDDVAGPGPPLSRWLDYRLIVVGSLVPDMIDKPLGFLLAPDLVNNGTRSLAHGVVFALLLMAVATVWFRHTRRSGLLGLSGAAVCHLILDRMWGQPEIALWPFLGWSFPAGTADLAERSSAYLRDLLTFYTDGPELVGAVVIVLFALRLWRTRTILPFLRTGVVA